MAGFCAESERSQIRVACVLADLQTMFNCDVNQLLSTTVKVIDQVSKVVDFDWV